MEMFTNYFNAIAFDIFNLSLVGCGIVFVLALALVALFLVLKCNVIYYDMDGGEHELHREKHSWLSRVKIHSANKRGKRLVGWSLKPNGKKPLLKHKIVLYRTVKLYAIWETVPYVAPAPVEPEKVELPEDELDYSDGIYVKFNYVDTQSDEIVSSEGFRINGKVPCEEGVDGWCFQPKGEIALKNGTENHVFEINLYPVCALLDEEIEVSSEPFGGECIVDLAYIMSSTDKAIYKESHYLKLSLPALYEAETNFIGWSNEPDGNVILERGESDTVFTLKFFSYEEEVVEEPIEEPVEEVAEEVVEEVVPAPLYEEVIEEYIAPVVEESEFEDVVEEYVEPAEEVAEVVEEPVEEPAYEDVVEETPVEEVAEEVVEEVAQEPVEEAAEEESETNATIVPTYYDNEGNKIDIKYSRSFTANIIQADDTVKDYYSELKNHILSYKGVKSRISWKFDSYNKGRDQLFKIKLRGKTICLYCALDPNEFDESRYHHEAIDAKIFEDVPMLVKIKSGLGLRKAKELVDIVMAKFGIEKDPKAKEVDYVAMYPYEPNEPLLARVLIKALEADGSNVVVSTKPKEEAVEETPVVEEPIVEEAAEEPVVEEPIVEEVAEEPVVEEPIVEETVEEPVVEEPVVEYVEPEIVVESVSAEEAHHIVEEKHVDIHVEEDVDYITKNDTKKAIVNIDTLSKSYNAGEIVDMASMKAKKLIDKKAKSVKVLARGVLDKPLRVKAGEFSGTAIEMILLTGGQAMHVTYQIKK